MAKAVGVGRVAEWFKALVLKTHAVDRKTSQKWRKSNINKPRISRCSRSVPRFAMAHNPAQTERAGKLRQQPSALSTNAWRCADA
jgi:hypothetical protein